MCSLGLFTLPLCIRSGLLSPVVSKLRFGGSGESPLPECSVDNEGLFLSMFEVAITGCSPLPPFVVKIFCGLSGLTLVELLRLLVFLECCTPWTMLVLRWWPYETEGFLSMSRLCFGLECAAGVTPRGEAFRVPAALRARPRVRDGSREAGGGKGAVFGAMRRGSGGGLVPVRSGWMDGEVAWPRPSEDSSRGAMGRTG